MRNFNRDDRPRKDFGGRRDFGRRSFNDRGRDRQMFPTVCSSCGKNCMVPFEPSGSKPVYCNDCFRRDDNRSDSGRFQDRGSRRPDFERRNDSRPQNNEQLEAINRKLDKIMEMIAAGHTKKEKKIKPEEIKTIPKKNFKPLKIKTTDIKK